MLGGLSLEPETSCLNLQGGLGGFVMALVLSAEPIYIFVCLFLPEQSPKCYLMVKSMASQQGLLCQWRRKTSLQSVGEPGGADSLNLDGLRAELKTCIHEERVRSVLHGDPSLYHTVF